MKRFLTAIIHNSEFRLLLIQVFCILPGLAVRTLWLDEAYSAILARKSFSEIHHAMVYDAGPPLYYDLLHIWRIGFGESEAALRAMSLAFSLLTTVLIYRFCLTFFTQSTAWISTLLWILSPISVYYAQEARNYTLFTYLTFLYLFCLVQYCFHNRNRMLIYSNLILVLALYTHNMAWFLLPMGWTVILLFAPQRRFLLSVAASNALSLIIYLPWIPTLLAQMQNTEMTIGWVRQAWSYQAIWQTLNVFIPGGKPPVYLDLPAFAIPLQLITLLLVIGLLVVVLFRIHRPENRSIRLIMAVMITGLLFPYLFSLLSNPIYLPGRTDFFLFPWWCMILGYGISSLSHKIPHFAMLGVLIIEMLGLNVLHLTRAEPISEKDVITYINRYAESGELLVCTGLTRPTLEYYLVDKQMIILSYPSPMADHLAHLNERWFMQNHDIRQCAQETYYQVQKSSHAKRFWVVGSDRPINRPLWDLLQSDKSLIINRVQTPAMGLRKLQEPIFLERCEYKP